MSKDWRLLNTKWQQRIKNKNITKKIRRKHRHRADNSGEELNFFRHISCRIQCERLIKQVVFCHKA